MLNDVLGNFISLAVAYGKIVSIFTEIILAFMLHKFKKIFAMQ